MTDKPRKKYPLWRRFIRWVVYGLFGFVAFIILVVAIILLVPPFNGPILKTVLPRVGNFLHARIEVGYFSYNLFTGHLLIKDCLYTKSDPSQTKPFAKADLIEVRINPLELIGGLIHIKDVKIVGAKNYLRITSKGLENLPAPPPKEEKKPEPEKTEPLKPIKFPLIVDSVTVKDTQFELELEKPHLSVVVNKIDGKLSCDMYDAQKATAELQISQANVQYEKLKENIKSLGIKSEFNFADFSVLVDKIDLKTDRLETQATYSLKGLKWHKASMQFKAPFLNADASVAKDMFDQDVSGTISLKDLTFKADLPDYAAVAEIWSDSLKYHSLELKETKGHVAVKPCKIDVYPIRLKTQAGTITTRTNFNYCEKSTGNVKLENLDIPKILKALGIKAPLNQAIVSGDVDFEFSLKPQFAANFNAQLNADGLNLSSALTVKSAAIKASGDFKDSALKNVDLSLTNDGLALNARGDVNFKPLALFLSYDVIANPSLITPYKIAGDIKIKGEANGPPTSASHKIDIESDKLEIYGLPINSLAASIKGAGMKFNIEQLTSKAIGGNLEISGAVDLKSQALEADVKASDIALSELKSLVNVEISGSGDITAKASGKLTNPVADLECKIYNISAFGESVDSATVLAKFENMKVDVERAVIQKGEGSISAVGTFDLKNKELVASGKIDSLDLEQLAFSQKLELRGVSQGTFEFTGPVSTLSGRAEIDVSSLEVMAQSLGSLIIKAEPIELPKQASLNLSLPDTGLKASANVNLETKAVGLVADLEKHPLAAWLNLAGLKGADGVASLHVNGYIPMNNPLETNAKITFKELEVNWQEQSLKLAQEGYLEITKGSFANADLRITGDLLDLNIMGAETAWLISAKADAKSIGEFLKLPGELRGTVEVDAQLAGRATEPKWEGTIELKRGFVDMPYLPQPIDSVTADLWFDSSQVKILNFVAKTGGGEAKIEGEVTYSPEVRFLLSLAANSIETGYEPTLELTIDNADLFAIGSLEKLYVAGDVSLAEATITQDIDLQTLLVSLRKKAVSVKTFRPQAEWISFNVAVKADKGLFFRSNLAEVELASNLIVTGTNQKLGLLGTINSLEGWADVLKNRFTLSSAVIQFYDPNRIFPMFDINAETNVQDISIRANISGTPDSWQITFSSEPPRSEQDIVALLSLGVDYDTFKQSGMAQTASEEVAYRAAAQLLGSSVNRFFGKYTNMNIDIDTSQIPARLKLSTDLSNDLAFSFYREISGTGVEAQLEYSFFPLISILGDWRVEPGITQELGAVGAGLEFKLEFQ